MLLTFALYLVPALRIVQLQPDAAEYVDVARHLVAGQGYTAAIKASHFWGTDVVHDGLQQRAPLYTFLVAAILGLRLPLVALQVANAGLIAGCIGLVLLIGERLFGRQIGLLTAGLAIASPVVLTYMLPPMSEALAIFLSLLAVWLVIRAERPRPLDVGLAGGAVGLAYLTRQPLGVLAVPLLLGAAVAYRGRAALRPLAALLSGLALVVAPVTLWSLVTHGSLSYSGQSYLYAVFDETDVRDNAFRRPLVSPLEFVRANAEFVVRAVGEHVVAYARLLFGRDEWLLLLLPAWPFVLLAAARRRYGPAAWTVLFVAAANFAVYAATWSTFKQRYLLLTLLLLLPFAVDGVGHLGRLGLARLRWGPINALQLAALALALYWSGTLLGEYRLAASGAPQRDVFRGVLWTGIGDLVDDPDFGRLIGWIEANAEPGAIVAHPQPWPFTFYTERPAVLLPRRLDLDQLGGFLRAYRVSYVLLTDADRRRLGYADSFETLAIDGVRSTSVGAYRVYDTRALWR